ncbi:MAG: hypothetical protein GY861_06625 [bacterium]|nr:hypothetical protein [bacterium]
MIPCPECSNGGIPYGGGREARCGRCFGDGYISPLCECGAELYTKIDLESEMCPDCRWDKSDWESCCCASDYDEDTGICLGCGEHCEGMNEWEETQDDLHALVHPRKEAVT